MAQFSKVFKDGEVINTLVFRDRVFVMTMSADEDGVSKSKEKCFSHQLKKAFPDDDFIDDIEDIVDNIDCSDEDEILESLEQLEDLE